MNEPDWRKLKLSLERPYTDDAGLPIPVLQDITPEGHLIYEPYVSCYLTVVSSEAKPLK